MNTSETKEGFEYLGIWVNLCFNGQEYRLQLGNLRTRKHFNIEERKLQILEPEK